MKRFLLLLMFACSFALISAQTGTTVTGTIKDNLNRPVVNASVLIKGTNIGTVSDAGGNFDIKSTSGNITLIVSSVGYEDQEISVKNNKLNIILQESNQGLDEVIVMGYNSVDKQHVASSIAQLDMEQTKTRPIMKMQQAFSGTIPGVTMLQGSSLPGSTFGAINIRGISTLQNAEPLVIVDGMEQSISDLDPNQIKSLTVLKDAASASMYGSRGANGVIIIETERGTTGQFKVDLNLWSGFNQAIDLPKFVNAADYMRINNETREHQGQATVYTDADIQKAETGEIQTVDWMKEIMQKTSMVHNQSANISGGGGVGTFNLMLGHIAETGLNKIEGTQKFSARFNTNINIAEKFSLLADFYAHQLQVDRLLQNDDGHGLYKIAWRMNPTQQVYYDSDLTEHYMLHNDLNPVARMNRGGIKNNIHDRSTINLRPKYFINKNLNLEGNVSYMISKSANKTERKTFKYLDAIGKPISISTNATTADQGVSESQLTARALVNYTSELRDDKDKIYFTAGTEVMNHTYTDYREISKASFFGKLNYSFDNRYILEATGRYDGSSKFAPEHKWGFFPSAALAWNAHNESFFSSLRNSGTITNLKLRASYGLIGNENVEPYLWEEIVNQYGWTMRVPNYQFSWEKQKQWNIGVDISTLKDRLSLTAEVYDKFSYDLIYDEFPVPPLTGSYYLYTAINIGEVRNKGYEFSAKWNDKIGNVQYSIGGSFFDNTNEVLKAGYSTTDTLVFSNTNDKIWYKGTAIDNYYGFESNGYFNDADDIANTPAKMANTLPGDIKYVDQNGDGIINDADRVNLGDPFPHLNYAINFDIRYKNWDFSVLGQGVGKRLGWLRGQEGYPVLVDGSTNALGAPRQEYADNRWTPTNTDSRFPRVWSGASTNAYLSDVWLSDASYFRIKMIQLGFTVKNIGKSFKNTRFYVNVQDAITFTKWEGLEPERVGIVGGDSNYDGNGSYPRMATYTFGIRTSIF
ncbi:SusC/RagA family TonB-linked outer membrane protein [Sphingobacterium pedocola]|uniref:SusC/RagA family TonB-linked outer membrane protein n=2 Tax=Bacteria TaxID=2 RepID=A0ABR9TBB3_9SPHI|nr:SusC/RagA family TonB-linked outer membrane protein [Sphingobacterium pedocola]MBE8722359.1 SusC/RagA family TonB-linked outer membrane protein [Sphingobacterium pedocola]